MSCTAGRPVSCLSPLDLMRRPNADDSASPRPPRSVARNLFGRADPDENRRLLEREMRRIRQDDSQRWNFDFHAERPLSGRFRWRALQDGHRDEERGDGDEACPRISSSSSAAELMLPTRELSLAADSAPRDAVRGEPPAAAVATNTRQTTMKEYWPERKAGSGRKRPASTEASPVSSKTSPGSETSAKKSKQEPQL